MTPPSTVTIDISQKPPEGQEETIYPPEESSDKVKLGKEELPLGSGFWKFTHKPPSEDSFTVAQVVFGSNTVSDIGVNPSDNIQHLSVWYWKGDQGMTNPLLAEVLKDGNYAYNYNKGGGTSWSPFDGNSRTIQLTGEYLEAKLDHLNCSLNRAVTITLTFQNSSSISDNLTNHGGNNTYCCRCEYHSDNDGHRKISVTLETVSCAHKSADCYKHTINSGGFRLAKIKYHITRGDGQWRRIKHSELAFPIEGQVEIYTFYSSQNPVLIYVDGGSTTGWYKKPTNGNTNDEQWEKVQDGLKDIAPEEIQNNCDNWNKLVGLLKEAGCGGLKECEERAKQQESTKATTEAPKGDLQQSVSSIQATHTTQEEAGSGEDDLGGPAVGNKTDTGNTEKALIVGVTTRDSTDSPSETTTASDSEQPTSRTPSTPAAITGAEIPIAGLLSWSTLGASSGTLAGSAATFFGGWKLYNRSRGDPWVRQI
ncbi:hypothetical protein BEWA_005800 [Theileria equi strain WA]|uniref:Uncharacterized protein n=1 Tax=Theileria equi strain WA TaxID=1537102 RepID=L0AZY7_THEEQ|nr:hypothetical protein BEWA_005800 [Theileria equi strain WA]AFZ81172.1 hypothetical protein BEWA_005800 [Theileria equi strain WA]|eukprot:XP_004830838.1 hypothetical protein BEWA_005800 [Theileria equi strain WA]